ncbi:MAG: hypothetical protein ACQEXJ_24095 [Myxococcota bacterium]
MPSMQPLRRSRRSPLLLLLAVALVSCGGEPPDVLRSALETGGPRVVYDIDAQPFPEIPFPNDTATRLEPDSPTGRRLNVSMEATTHMERRFRRKLNRLDGFGLMAPISVGFDAPLDLEDVRARHVDDRDPSNDGILLIRLDGGGDVCGGGEGARRRVPLDVGHGNYPIVLERPCQYNFHLWEGEFICEPKLCDTPGDDARAGSPNLLFETVQEDLDGDGVLDPYEDTDFDGHLDTPNTWSGQPHTAWDDPAAQADDMLTFWESETNTLITWPMVPLREGSRYAVVLTKHLKDRQGRPVESPFDGIAAASQAEPLSRLEEMLPCWGLTLDDVAFAWTFTTGTHSDELLAIREGLYGSGPLAGLGAEVPVEGMRARPSRDPDEDGELPDSPYVLPRDLLEPLIAPLSGELLETPGAGDDLLKDTKHVAYWAVGDYQTPYFLVDKDGRATPEYPDDQDESFDVDLQDGEAVRSPSTVPFICSVPETTEEHRPPFPVVIYAHGYSGASFETLGFAGRFAKAGFALCSVEAPGHGVVIPADEEGIASLVELLVEEAGLANFYDSYIGGRVRDNDNDGVIGARDNGTDFWVADVFHTRDMLRQQAIDQMQFIRSLRAVDGERRMATDTDGDGAPDLLADFDGDGVPDLGGWSDEDGDGVRDPEEPEHPYYVWGQSLGGIASATLAAVEPAIQGAAPISGAGGLVQVGIRSTNLGVPEAVLLPIIGPFVTFAPHADEEGQPDGRVDVGFLVPNVNEPARPVFHVSDAIRPGDRVVVENVDTGEYVEAFAGDDLRFRVGIQADALRLGDKREYLGLTDDSELPVAPSPDTVAGLGDRLRVLVHDGWDGPVKETIEAVARPFVYQGVRYGEGTPLVALHEGLGYTRNSPDFRRLLAISQTVLAPGDPATYARFALREPLDFPYETGDVRAARDAGDGASVLLHHTVGDADVPIAAGITLARALGLVDFEHPDPERGRTEMEVLREHHVVEGIDRLDRYVERKDYSGFCPWQLPETEWTCPAARPGEEDRYRAFFTEGCPDADPTDCDATCPEGQACFYDGICVPCEPMCAQVADADLQGVHFDVMDLDRGTDRLVLPEYDLDDPLRPTVETSHGTSAFRIPYVTRTGSHGVPPSIPERAFNVNSFVVNQIITFFGSRGESVRDDPCLADGTCEFLPWNE